MCSHLPLWMPAQSAPCRAGLPAHPGAWAVGRRHALEQRSTALDIRTPGEGAVARGPRQRPLRPCDPGAKRPSPIHGRRTASRARRRLAVPAVRSGQHPGHPHSHIPAAGQSPCHAGPSGGIHPLEPFQVSPTGNIAQIAHASGAWKRSVMRRLPRIGSRRSTRTPCARHRATGCVPMVSSPARGRAPLIAAFAAPHRMDARRADGAVAGYVGRRGMPG